jgi:hypothetical protein
LVRSRHAAGIEKQNTATPFISRHMGMAVHKNIDPFWPLLRWNMLQPKFETPARKIDNQWPLEIAVAISTHDHHRRPDCAQLIHNSFRTNIAEMPNLIRLARKIDNLLWKSIMRIGEDEDGHKPQPPNPKHQGNFKLQASKAAMGRLVIEDWNFPGGLVLGIWGFNSLRRLGRALTSIRVI